MGLVGWLCIGCMVRRVRLAAVEDGEGHIVWGEFVGRGFSLVPDVGDEAGVAVDLVGDDLRAAVGQLDAVLAVRLVTVPVLVLGEDGRVVVAAGGRDVVAVLVDGVAVGVVVAVVGGAGVVGQGGGDRQGEEEEGLERGLGCWHGLDKGMDIWNEEQEIWISKP